jgi:ABC-type multidrug transport system ATPase subunit
MCGCSTAASAAAAGEEDAGADGQLLGEVTAGSSSGSGSSSRSWLSGGQRREDFWAIRGTWLGIERGQLFCLLGPNGAGKTTTIHTLTGVLPFSGGDALIYGSSIKGEAGLDAVRPLMGVCPQFDVLWGELSGREHLTIAGHIKGLPWNKVS